MIRHYWISAFRNMLRNRAFSLLYLNGLAMAAAFCILVFMYVRYESGYDRFHEQARRIFYVTASSDSLSLNIAERLGPKLAESYPEIEACIRFGSAEAEAKAGPDRFKQRVFTADPAFFETFSFPLEQGKDPFPPGNPDVVVLSRGAALKHFGSGSPLGQTVSLNFGDRDVDFLVTGVLASIPGNSSLVFDLLIPTRNAMFADSGAEITAWRSFEFGCFIRLDRPDALSGLRGKTDRFLQDHMSELFDKLNLDVEKFRLDFTALPDFHLKSDSHSGGLVPPVNPLQMFILSGIGLLVLLISCFNFINLTIARSAFRFKEIAVRKVVGASRGGLIRQFWFESGVLVLASLALSFFWVEILRPVFNGLTGRDLTLAAHFYTPDAMIFLAGLALLIWGLLGVQPVLLISRLEMVEIFKGKLSFSGRRLFSRTVLIFQFALSLFLIVEAAVVFKQKTFLLTRDLGFSKNDLIAVPTKTSENEQNRGARLLSLFREQSAVFPSIAGVSGASGLLDKNRDALVRRKDGVPVVTLVNRVDFDYVDLLGLRLAEGRNFSRANPSDPTAAVLVNETFVKTFEISDPVGSPVPDLEYGDLNNPVIVGVIQDYNYLSLRERIHPVILHMDDEVDIQYLLFKVTPGRTAEALENLRGLWGRIRPEKTFEYFFLDEEIRSRYREEERWNRIVGYASGFSIFIAALGLMGLTGITIVRRFKEIGVRKVLGASPLKILGMIYREYLPLVAVANLLVWPAAYFVSRAWLRNFAYRTALSPWEFILGGAVVLVVAVVTVSAQAFKASLLNPGDILREE